MKKSYTNRKLTNKQEWVFAQENGKCPKCHSQMLIVASRYIDNGSSYTLVCKEHGYFELKMQIFCKK
jgi:ssDNA-binding Zn-finger/Zn-ribbon topoisomerase 1